MHIKTLDDYDGRIVFKNGVEYIGSIENGNIHGNGKMIFKNGIIYTGEFVDNKINGHGKLDYGRGEYYEGEFENFQKCGQGKYVNEDQGLTYEGEWEKNDFCGQGKLVKNGQWVYTGNFLRNQKHGKGSIIYLVNQSQYTGQFINGLKEGYGEMNWTEENDTYKGQWKQDKIEGFGIYNYKNQQDTIRFMNNIYIGFFSDNNKNGMGVHLFSDGSSIIGKWEEGIKNGTFLYRDRLGHFSLKEFKNNHLSKTTVCSNSLFYYSSELTLPKIILLNEKKTINWMNILKSYFGTCKAFYQTSLEETAKSKIKDRDTYCMNLTEVLNLLKNLKIFSTRVNFTFVENFIRTYHDNAFCLVFDEKHIEEVINNFEKYVANKTETLKSPFNLSSLKNDQIFVTSYNFINILFLILQHRFDHEQKFETIVRRYFDNWLIPIFNKSFKPPNLYNDQKSVLILYNSFIKTHKNKLLEIYDNFSLDNKDGKAKYSSVVNFLIEVDALNPESRPELVYILRVFERYNDPLTTIYKKMKTCKTLDNEQKCELKALLDCSISFEEFYNSIILYLHKKIQKEEHNFPKNFVISFFENILSTYKYVKVEIKNRVVPKKQQKIVLSLLNCCDAMTTYVRSGRSYKYYCISQRSEF